MWKNLLLASLLGCAGLVGAACEGPPGPDGPDGIPISGEAGPPGPPGEAGAPAPSNDASLPRSHADSGPGLKLAVSAVTFDATGVATVSFSVTDGAAAPLDLTGKYTDGAVVPKFVLSFLREDANGNALDYAAYTTQDLKSVDGTMHAAMPEADVGGIIAEVGAGNGTYTYAFATKLPATFDKTKTHTIGIWAYRDFGGKRYVVNTLFDFVPSGIAVKTTRDIVNTQACNQCHNPLQEHDDGRRDVRLCILCHSTPTVDVSNGESLAMPTMIHRIHRGKNLPSVIGGATYQLTTEDRAFEDHSDTWFPGGDAQNCAMCHKGSQGDVWKKAPTRATCGACHDRTSFSPPPAPAGFHLHPGDPQPDDTKCTTCHTQSGTPGVSLVDAHMTASTQPSAPVLDLAIASVATTAPGQTPVLHFTVTKDGQPLDILTTKLNSLVVTIAGPTTDYANAQPTQYTIQGTTPTPGGTLALDGAVGSYAYTFPAPIAPTATGTWAVGMEGYTQAMVGLATFRYASHNPVSYVAVTDPTPVPRRQVVDRDKCNSCHYDLNAHGGGRKSPEYCVLCHTPNKVDDQRVARFEVPTTVAESVSFKVLVHKIHRGNDLEQGYVVGSFPAPTTTNPGGTPVDFGKVAFPGNLRACWACHSGTTYQLPLPAGLLPTKTKQVLACNDLPLNPASYCNSRTVQSESFLQPVSAACTACHDKPANVAHAQIMTAPDGTESCETCHGSGAQWDVQVVHALDP
jgi:OmcA/MtrC family decaheme c-type cytochrome